MMLSIAKRLFWLMPLVLIGCAPPPDQPVAAHPNYIFEAGKDGYACFRIPALSTTMEQRVLAFAEGRKKWVLRHRRHRSGDEKIGR